MPRGYRRALVARSTEQDRRRRCRVLHVLSSMDVGGAETYVLNVLRHFDRDMFEMDVCCTRSAAGALAPQVAARGSRVIACRYGNTVLPYACRLARVLRSGGYDVVCDFAGDFAAGSMLAGRVARVPARIALYRSSSVKYRPTVARRVVAGALHRAVLQHATVVLGNSRANLVSAFAPREIDHRFAVVYNGVDLTRFGPADEGTREVLRADFAIPPDVPVVGHVGSFVPVKAHDILLRAFAAVTRSHPRARLVMVGDGPLKPYVAAEAARLGVADRVILPGLRHDVHRLLHVMDLFVLPSRFEGCPNALLEAQAAALPVVASDRPEIRESMPLENHDLLAGVDDADAFARIMARLICNPREAGARAAAGASFVRRHRLIADSVAEFCGFMLRGAGMAAPHLRRSQPCS